ncbi:hypothetical protein [Microvirga sp. M2]|uniref:hypothetical protein n=1 Tax=Microvirga sp. M2 TaxID=3073270 RepID=UPI0039C2EF1E
MTLLGSQPIAIRMLIRDKALMFTCRVIHVSLLSGETWLCRVDDDSWPFAVISNEFHAELNKEDGRFDIELDDPLRRIYSEATTPNDDRSSKPGMHISASDQRHIDRYNLIAPLISADRMPAILVPATRKVLIAARLQEVTSTRQNICRLLKLFFKRGMTFAALQPDYRNCGGPGKKRNTSGKKIGRPRKFNSEPGINVNDEVRSYLHVGAQYLFRTKCSLRVARNHVIDTFFAEDYVDDVGRLRVRVDANLVPTLRQFRYFIETTYPFATRHRKLLGERRWNLEGRSLVGRADAGTQGPGDRYYIDATIGDVYLRSQFDRHRIVGRPVIYFVVDSFSRMIVGIYVGFEGPSWIGAMMALVNVVTPKKAFCERYGILIDECDWPSHFLGRVLQADCGEFKSTRLGQNITQGLRVEIDNIGPWRPDLQALVERRFGSVPARFKDFVPGYIKPDFGERGAEDYRLKSQLNLFEYTGFLIRAVIEHNLDPIEGKAPPAEMITDGMTACPIDLWNWGVANRSGSLTAASVDEVALAVMCPDKARVTAKGIRFKGEYYSCPTAMQNDWFALARRQEWDEKISYDPRDLGEFYLRNPSLPNGYEICRLLDANSDRAGKTLAEVEELDYANKTNLAATESQRISRQIQFAREMKAVRKRAAAEARAIGDSESTNSERLASISQNRSQEKDAQRREEKFSLGSDQSISRSEKAADTTQDEASIDSVTRDLLELLEQQHQDRERTTNG